MDLHKVQTVGNYLAELRELRASEEERELMFATLGDLLTTAAYTPQHSAEPEYFTETDPWLYAKIVEACNLSLIRSSLIEARGGWAWPPLDC